MVATTKIHHVPGGVLLPGRKHLSFDADIQYPSLPSQLLLPLGQHMGAPALPCVDVGDSVLGGQVLAQAAGNFSAAIHAPTSGTIKAIANATVPHSSYLEDTCITLTPDNLDHWLKPQPLQPDTCAIADIKERIKNSGIVGMGGAGFPSSLKLSNQPIEMLIINGVECEPYITSDDILMRHYGKDLLCGIEILLRLTHAKSVIVAIEANKAKAIASLKQVFAAAKSDTNIQVITVPTQYPAGGERQLVQQLLGKELPSGTLPIQLGVVFYNVATIVAIAHAVRDDKPLTHRLTTVTGDALEQPANYWCPIGMPVDHLLALSGCQAHELHTLVMGGPMMGFALQNSNVPIVKTSNCIIAADNKEFPDLPLAKACIRCNWCADVCPVSLLPQQLYWFARNNEQEKSEHYNLFDCIECGACAWVCPSHIPLVQYYRAAKGTIRHRRAEEKMAQRSKQRYEDHQERIDEEKKLLEERRKARRAVSVTNAKQQQEISDALKRVNKKDSI